jgi:succinoglycan biosynthesis protein ExoV
MAIYYHSDYSRLRNSRNFGDDINPTLLRAIFDASIIESSEVCVVGIGTILNERHIAAVSHYRRKVVFSSGAAGTIRTALDPTWDIVCVRGPRTAAALGLPENKAICDGAILLSDLYPPKAASRRDGIVFIPHVNTGWSAGRGLRKICEDLGLVYLLPDAPNDVFIDVVRSASLVLTEAMHGAILADTMRTPWIAVTLLHHNRFKWEDWCASIELPYASHVIEPAFWDPVPGNLSSLLKRPYQRLKQNRASGSIRRIRHEAFPALSDPAVLEARKAALREKVDWINGSYG